MLSKKNKLLLIIFSIHLLVISIILGGLSLKNKDYKQPATSDEVTTFLSTTEITTKETTTTEITTKKQATTNNTTTRPTTTNPKTTIVTTHKQTTKPTTQAQSTTIKNSNYYTKSEVEMVARVLYSECRGVTSKTQKACVAWVICNRADAYGKTISGVVLSKNQFAYNKYSPVQSDLHSIASDVLSRWAREKNGEANVGRVLPKNYLYFHGDGKINYFKTNYTQPYKIWDYSLPSPYSS